jgi:hypothetical protein
VLAGVRYSKKTGMVGKSFSAAARHARHHDFGGEAGINYKEMSFSDRKLKNISEMEKSKSITWSFIRFGSQRFGSQQSSLAKIGDSGEDISFRQHLPPIELREEEYFLSALMANSR